MLSFTLLFYVFLCSGVDTNTNCFSKETCSDCVQNTQCIWCSAPYAPISKETIPIHCANRNINNKTWCPSDKIVDPKTVVDKDELLENRNNESGIQISPQKVKITARKGEKIILPFQYRQTENYPVDLYYLMGLTRSMEIHREQLIKLGSELVHAMKNLTSNFRIGFGSFVDKSDMPFISIRPEKLTTPCKLRKGGREVNCIPAYSFKNHISLTKDFDAFYEGVLKAKFSGNIDFPEGGFDAIMQTIVCKTEIGWRNHARHIIVFSTDADFHIAGDGKLAGIVEPNDAECHLKDGQYTHDLIYDYPSISHINYVAKQNNINLIFAIVKNDNNNDRVLNIYKNLLNGGIDNSVVDGLTKNSDNIVSLIVNNYEKIVSSVAISDDSGNDVDISYSSTCSYPRKNGCGNVLVGELINFTASITPLHCLSTNSSTQLIKIKPEGTEESLEIDLSVVCGCSCERRGHPDFILGSSNCTNQGDSICGVCSCYPGRFGTNCQCDSTMSDTMYVSTTCKQNANSTRDCSGLGFCKCGKCECFKRPNPQIIYGKYCQCDNYSCKRSNGRLCSGKRNGECDCGECRCFSGWTGDACECPNTNTSCIAPGLESEGLVCSGKGSCVCGDCRCHEVHAYRYSGKYCEECPSCPGQRCEELRHCVECQAYKSGIYSTSECSIKCSSFTVSVVDRINEDSDEENIKICRAPDNSGCTTLFQYTYDDNKDLVVSAQRTKICSESEDLLVIILGVTGSIIVPGIISLITWKVGTTIHDRQEYAKFEKERSRVRWCKDENPLFKKATAEFKNPLYKR